VSTSTETSTKPQTSNFKPIVNHYTSKAEILQSIIEGTPVKALCGETYVVKARGGGQVRQKTNGVLVICPLCAHIHDGLKGINA
jgi:hypothetical protein